MDLISETQQQYLPYKDVFQDNEYDEDEEDNYNIL